MPFPDPIPRPPAPAVLFPPLVQSKLHPPRCPPLLARPRLLTRLTHALASGVTFISAPPGFGKTALLTAWLATTLIPVAWITLDGDETTLVQFWQVVISALATLVPACATLLDDLPDATATLTSVLSQLVNCWISDGGEGVLVLDQFDLVTHPAMHVSLQWFMEHLPPTLHLVVLSRAAPPFPLHRWRARRHAVVVPAMAFACTPVEGTTLLHDLFDLALTAAERTALVTHTQGWIGGLSMLASSAQAETNPRALLQAELQQPQLLTDYIRAELVPAMLGAALPEAVQQWYQTTPVVRAALAPTHASTTHLPHSVSESPLAPLLTPTEQALLPYLMRGCTTPAIATQLHLTRRTVEWHLQNIYGKLHVRTRTAAVTRALALGLIVADP